MAETTRVIHNLPRPTTSFIGREQEIAEITRLLDDPVCQLLTLVGPGGIGKTRLALKVAQQSDKVFADGKHFVSLQPLQTADHIPATIIHAMELPIHEGDPQQQLLHYLKERSSLLILDNFEHLLEGVGLIADILAAAPDVKLLVTSRETLNLHEEWLWPVQGLPFPPSETGDNHKAYSAERLFVERVCQVRPTFEVKEHYAAVARICQLVEGVPLALELAASWTKSLSCEAIAQEIQNDIDFLTSRARNTPEGHRSMRAVFNRSWRLLFEEEREVFQRLSVFRGGFTREAAEQVAGTSLAILASLVDKSFVRQDPSGRYNIHELMRQFGTEQLTEFGEADSIRDSHAAYFADFLADCAPELEGHQQLAALNKIEANFDNIRAAWSHAIAQRAYQQVDRMIDGLTLFGYLSGRIVETGALFEVAGIALAPSSGDSPHPVWGRVLARAPHKDIAPIEAALDVAQCQGNDAEIAFCLLERGMHYAHRLDFAHALSDLQGSLNIYRCLEDRFWMARSVEFLAWTAETSGDWDAANEHINLGLRLARELGNQYYQHRFLFYAGWAACYYGRYEDAERELQEASAIAKVMGFRVLAADSAGSFGFLAFLRGDFQQARAWITEDLEAVVQVKALGEQGFAMIVLAHIACVEENYHEGKQYAEEALALVKPHPPRERFIARVLAMAACGLGEYDQARTHLRMLLVQETCPGARLWFIPACAILLARDGNLERAAELLGLSFTHPSSATGWLEQWPLLTRLRVQLAAQLGEQAYTAAWERGSHLGLDTVIEQLRVETDTQVKQPLTEPLTDRELEVLRLVAAGLSNREIAATLTVVVGTVRTHVYNLCQKLSAGNRTQAVARARALRILL